MGCSALRRSNACRGEHPLLTRQISRYLTPNSSSCLLFRASALGTARTLASLAKLPELMPLDGNSIVSNAVLSFELGPLPPRGIRLLPLFFEAIFFFLSPACAVFWP